MKRRSFLAGLTAGAVAAPAIVRASSLMKLWVPPKRPNMLEFCEIVAGPLPEWQRGFIESLEAERQRLCGIGEFRLAALNPQRQPVADRIEVTIRRQLQAQGGLSMLMAAQQERDRELRKAMREMAGRTLDEILRG